MFLIALLKNSDSREIFRECISNYTGLYGNPYVTGLRGVPKKRSIGQKYSIHFDISNSTGRIVGYVQESCFRGQNFLIKRSNNA